MAFTLLGNTPEMTSRFQKRTRQLAFRRSAWERPIVPLDGALHVDPGFISVLVLGTEPCQHKR
jgi:hypothetical protein